MAASKTHIDPYKLELYDRLVASIGIIERKGKNNPYTSRNGYMFSFIDKLGIVSLRFSPQDYDSFLTEYGDETGASIQFGRTMQGYLTIPLRLLKTTAILATYLQKSYDYIGTLKPKPKKSKKPKLK